MTTTGTNIIALLEPVIYKTVSDFATSNTALSETARQNASKCVSGFQQSLGIVIKNSQLLVTGNFEARQQATIVMSCANPALSDPSAKSALQSALTTAISAELAKNNIANVSDEVIRASVARNIDNALTECRDDGGNQRIASGGSIIFKNATVKIGVCTEDKLNSATADCVGGDATKQAAGCKALADCLKKEGNFIFESGVNIRSSCSEKLYQIAVDIAKAASPTTPKPGTTDSGSSSFWSTKNILIAAAIALAIILLVVVIVVLSRQGSQPPQMQTTYLQPYGSSLPLSYPQSYR